MCADSAGAGRLQHDYVGECARRDAAVAHALAGSLEETGMERNRPAHRAPPFGRGERLSGRRAPQQDGSAPRAGLLGRHCAQRARTPAAGGWARRRRSRRASPSTTRPAPPASPARWTRGGSSRCSRTPPLHRSLSPTRVRRAHAPRRNRAGRRLVQSRRSRQARDRALPSRTRFTSPATPGRARPCRRRPASDSHAAAPRPPARTPSFPG